MEEKPKSKKCDWCNKRKLIRKGYWLGKYDTKKDWFICEPCNLQYDVI